MATCRSCGDGQGTVIIEHYVPRPGADIYFGQVVEDHWKVCEDCWHVMESLSRLERNLVMMIKGGVKEALDAAKYYIEIAEMLDWHLHHGLDFQASRLAGLANRRDE